MRSTIFVMPSVCEALAILSVHNRTRCAIDGEILYCALLVRDTRGALQDTKREYIIPHSELKGEIYA